MTDKRQLFVELHALVSYPPSNLNRDDLGAPKTAVFGGVRRLRISSQCVKRSWRTSEPFAKELEVERARLGVRTSQVGDSVVRLLGDDAPKGDGRRGFDVLLASLGRKSAKLEAEEETSADDDAAGAAGASSTAHLLYLSQDEHAALAAFVKAESSALDEIGALLQEEPIVPDNEAEAPEGPAASKGKKVKKPAAAKGDKKKEQAIKKVDELRKRLLKHLAAYVPRSAVDVALFGRFLTESEFREIDAAMQVAHALGTQKADVEYDYFTAVDDRSGEAAAGHIGETELGASVFYKYAVCDTTLLRDNLGPGQVEAKHAEKDAAAKKRVDEHRANARGVATKALRGVVAAMAISVPSGKKNSTAPQCPADYLEVVVRRDAPLSLANAFLKPIGPKDGDDVMSRSITALREHASEYGRTYGEDGVVARLVLSTRDLGSAAKGVERLSLAALTAQLQAVLEKELPA